ncbi:FMN-binding negative transcriptional regulator [Aliikangiella marina]|uniref:FMN-binding negative transcriptional regulator n=1 Tax=Aliikangiella marina TaxID=1712262 RepID=A0A545T9U2_9GAMM|nr:FMN-binding negative transcriptional regulator [Aliikangiella marina]TQV73983.1 FMN-binding negative transcriptional regulator [Aliikangiella marina]
MYIPKHFNLESRESQLKFIRQNSFGDIVTCFNNQLEINHAPFLVDDSDNFLLCHLAKMNNHWKFIEKVDDLKVLFKGPDCYISPSWSSNPNTVPTWNYVSIQVSGTATIIDDEQLIELLENLSQQHEAQFERPWTIAKMEPRKFTAMRKAIVGLKISIDSIEAKVKLSQNKTSEELNELTEGLSKMNDENSQKILTLMQKASDLQR